MRKVIFYAAKNNPLDILRDFFKPFYNLMEYTNRVTKDNKKITVREKNDTTIEMIKRKVKECNAYQITLYYDEEKYETPQQALKNISKEITNYNGNKITRSLFLFLDPFFTWCLKQNDNNNNKPSSNKRLQYLDVKITLANNTDNNNTINLLEEIKRITFKNYPPNNILWDKTNSTNTVYLRYTFGDTLWKLDYVENLVIKEVKETLNETLKGKYTVRRINKYNKPMETCNVSNKEYIVEAFLY